MDYRSLLLAALCLFGVTLAAILLVTRRQAPRDTRGLKTVRYGSLHRL